MTQQHNQITNQSSLQDRLNRGDVLEKNCPSRKILRDITNRWGTLVLLALIDNTYRFSELRRKISGVSEKMLSQTLQALEEDGLVDRISYPVLPPHVEYTLTPLGEEAAQKVEQLTSWIENNLATILDNQKQKNGE
ncbi:winged helix-turn-helix transcriptional regulator [Vibrio viridaestus]|uniref:Transcriptional regulator n=1 Tax=Vibrio viridaestus TaxID=2487322 RepID=A0A3N9TCM7_9VIBR|nr:helix-turn-helix domain-containing protein [Vibrio viridaestus]RQW61819.1 transcriptional regulator [Vibrio viridaestus]